MADTILIVDDEASVRQTFADWLAQADLGCTLLAAADAESALRLANEHSIDLAILDWALGAGEDGLQLLQDLYAFHPDVVAIMVTGFANQATPLDAMRMGVRDYLDKNHDLNRETFVRAVRRQLDQIRPAKHQRQLHQSLAAFREAVQKVLPLVQSTAALNDPVPLPNAVRGLLVFLIEASQAQSGVLLARHFDADREPAEWQRVYDARGEPLEVPLVPFAHSAAGAAASLGQPCAMQGLDAGASGVQLQAFEAGKQNLLAIPMQVAEGTQVVVELFDKPGGFSAEDQRLGQRAAALGSELMRQALGQKLAQQLLFDALEAALRSGAQVSESLAQARALEVPAQVMEQLRAGLESTSPGTDGGLSVELAEAIRALAARHGPPALQFCLRSVEQVQRLLDSVTGDAG